MRGKLGMFFGRATGGEFGGLTRPDGWRAGPDFAGPGQTNQSIEYNSNFLRAVTTVKLSGDFNVTVKFTKQAVLFGGVRFMLNGTQVAQLVSEAGAPNGMFGTLPGFFAVNDVITVERVTYDGESYTVDTDGLVTITYMAMQIT